MMQLSLLIMLAFTIGNICKDLGTGIYVSNELKDILSPKFVPVLLFLTSCFISFSTGTSWVHLHNACNSSTNFSRDGDK